MKGNQAIYNERNHTPQMLTRMLSKNHTNNFQCEGRLPCISQWLAKLHPKRCNVEVLWVFQAIRFWQQFGRITCLGVVLLQVCAKYTKAVKTAQEKQRMVWPEEADSDNRKTWELDSIPSYLWEKSIYYPQQKACVCIGLAISFVMEPKSLTEFRQDYKEAETSAVLSMG